MERPAIQGGAPAPRGAGSSADAVGFVRRRWRLARLQRQIERQQHEFAARCVGRTLPVLFEKLGRRPGQLIGRSPYLQSVHAEAPANMLGRLLPVEISSFGPNSLAGVIRAE